MKTTYVFFLVFFSICLSSSCVFGQQYPQLFKTRPYKMWVKSMDNSKVNKVYLNTLEDSSIIYRNYSNFETSKIMVSNIKQIEFRRKEKIGRSILIGTVSGFALGGIIGLATGADSNTWPYFTTEEQTLIAGTLLAIPGAIVGAVVGTMKIKVPISGNQDNYIKQKEKLKTYIIEYP